MSYDRKSSFPNISQSSKERALALCSIHTPHSHLPSPPAACKIIDKRMLRWGSEIWEWEKHEEPFDESRKGSSSGDVELEVL